MARWTTGIGEPIDTGLAFDEATNAVWFVADGRLGSLRVLGRRARWHGEGWAGAVAAVPNSDGLTVLVVLASGEVRVAARATADEASSSVFADLGRGAVAAAASPDGRLVVLTDDGALEALDPRSGAIKTVVAGLAGGEHLAIDTAAGMALVALGGPKPELHRIDLAAGAPAGPPLALDAPAAALATHPGGDGAIVADVAGELRAVLWSGTDAQTEPTPGATALARWHSLVFVGGPSGIALAEWGDDVTSLPIDAGPDPLVRGGWAPFEVDYAAFGLEPELVEWRVAEGPEAGTVSVARPAAADRWRYEHRVLAGSGPAELSVEALDRGSGQVLATRRFRLVEVWPDDEVGPPLAITGAHRVYAKWGGGGTVPENIRIHPAPEEIRMAVVILRTKGASSSVDGGAEVARFEDLVGGGGESTKRYYEEVSARSTPASAVAADPDGSTVRLLGDRVFGPLDLPWSWGDLFTPDDQGEPWASWSPKGGTWDLLGGTFSSHLVDVGLAEQVAHQADSVVFAVLPGTDDPYDVGGDEWSAQWSWASASDAQMYYKTDFATGFIRRPAIVMPAAFPANHPSPWSHKEWVSTICHELAHNLGCPDLYNGGGAYPAEVDARMVDTWDLMHTDAALSHFTLAHRMRLGWVNPGWIEVCNFAANPASRTVTLQAVETIARSGPPSGRKAGVEVRIRPGWNYYFEYRRRQAGQVGDQTMPFSQAVVGTDVNVAAADEVARPLILMLPVDVDGDGPVLRAGGTDYEESDVTNPDRLNDFRLTRQAPPLFGGDVDTVTLQIDYVGAHRAELQVRPAPGRGIFKSPDIDLDGPGGPNVAVKGMTNKIKVRVRNAGSKGANDVNIRVQWLPFTTSAGPWHGLPSPARQTIPSKQVREFVVDWPLPASVTVDGKEAEHFCVRVDVDRYTDPLDPTGDEIVVHNNWAQSNFNTAGVGHGSPSERRGTALLAHNKLPIAAVHHSIVEQTGDQFRAYIDASWHALEPGADAVTMLEYESLAGDPLFGEAFERAMRESEQVGSDLTTRGFFHAPKLIDGPIERFGAQVFVTAGLRTFIRDAEARGEAVSGVVAGGWPEDSSVVDDGDVRVTGWLVDRPEEQFWRDSRVGNDGTFTAPFPEELFMLLQQGRVRVVVHYLGTNRFVPCHSDDLDVQR
jgi:hypothetical protein